MDELLVLVDALRSRGAIEISTDKFTVKFATPLQPAIVESTEEFVAERSMDAAEIERLLYSETSKM